MWNTLQLHKKIQGLLRAKSRPTRRHLSLRYIYAPLTSSAYIALKLSRVLCKWNHVCHLSFCRFLGLSSYLISPQLCLLSRQLQIFSNKFGKRNQKPLKHYLCSLLCFSNQHSPEKCDDIFKEVRLFYLRRIFASSHILKVRGLLQVYP